MKILKILLVVLIASGLIISLSGCGSKTEESNVSDRLVSVARGNISVDITTAGNLAFASKVDLSFEVPGTVGEVLVEPGDTVTEGQVLAKLDDSAWEDALNTLEGQVEAAQRDLTAKERLVTTKELALRQAEIDLQTTENSLDTITEVKTAQDAVDNAEYNLRINQACLTASLESANGGDPNYWLNEVSWAQSQLDLAQKQLADVLAGVNLTTDVALALESKQIQVEQAQMAVEDAQTAIDDANLDVEDAQKNLDDAQKAYDDMVNAGPDIVAPFAGFVTAVNIQAGDDAKKGAAVVQIADPTQFEADLTVGETDVVQLAVGQVAQVGVDALPGITLPALVTKISPTATIQQGVVNYKVTVEIESLQAMQQAIDEGRITQEQIDQFMARRQQGLGNQSGAQSASSAEEVQLREGQTVTVDIIVQQVTDVLMVPNGAITSRGGKTYVQVQTSTGTIEEREIETGISNWQYTEVTSGLDEGEQVVVPQGADTTSTSTSTTPQRQFQGGIGPGFGEILR
jgi:HlyD family secretion protein